MPKDKKQDAEPSRHDWKGWAALIVTVIAVAGAAIWVLHREFQGVHDGISRIDRRLDRFDSAFRILSNSQTDDIKQLINEILAQAREQAGLGNPSLAAKFVATAAKLTREEKQRRTPANPQFFELAAKELNQFRLSTHTLDQQVRTAKVELAEYRSAITPLGDNPPAKTAPGPARGPIVAGSRFSGGTQKLDGISWANVIFENMHIVYKGGPVQLRNVRFVNCTFDVSESPRGDQFLNVAILGESSATIG